MYVRIMHFSASLRPYLTLPTFPATQITFFKDFFLIKCCCEVFPSYRYHFRQKLQIFLTRIRSADLE
jgi:hypothetical protein